MKVKNIILTTLLACMLCMSVEAMKREHEDNGDERKDTKHTCVNISNINENLLSRLANNHNELIYVLSKLIQQYDSSTPQGISQIIKNLVNLTSSNEHIKNQLTSQIIEYSLINAGIENHTIRTHIINCYLRTLLMHDLSFMPDNILSNIISQLIESDDISTPEEIIRLINFFLRLGIFNNSLNSETVASILCAAGVNVNRRNTCKMTTLHVAAARTRCANVIHTLIAAGANVNETINNPSKCLNNPNQYLHGMTALHVAAFHGNIHAVNALINVFRCPNQKYNLVNAIINNPGHDFHGMTALHLAAHIRRFDIIQTLIYAVPEYHRAAFVNTIDAHNRTILNFLIPQNLDQLNTLHDLIQEGTDIHTQNHHGLPIPEFNNFNQQNIPIIRFIISVGLLVPARLAQHLQNLGINIPERQITHQN